MPPLSFLDEHRSLSRRFFLGAGIAGWAELQFVGQAAFAQTTQPVASPAPAKASKRVKPEKAGIRREPYFTPTEDFRDVSRGTPLPHSLPEDRRREVGLTRETWRLEVLSDPEHPAKLGREFRLADGTPFDFAALLKLAETKPCGSPR